MPDEVEVVGAEDLAKLLEELGPDLVKKALRDALNYSGAVLQEAQAAAAPVMQVPHGPHPPEQLKLDVRRVVRLKPAEGSGVVAVGPSTHSFYGSFAEFGTAHQQAKPWMRPAWDQSIDGAMATFEEVIAAYLNHYLASRK